MRNLSCLFFVLVLLSCKKDEPSRKTAYSYLDSTLKSNFSFHEGSCWVYQDQAMNKDSIILRNQETGFTSNCPRNGCDRHEFIKLNFENVTQGTSFNHYLLFNFIRYNGGGQWGQDGQPIFILDRDQGHEFNGLVVGESLDSMLVLGESFYNVKKMSVMADSQIQNEFDFNVDFYFAPSVGIIKYIVHDTLNGTTTWELKNYNIDP